MMPSRTDLPSPIRRIAVAAVAATVAATLALILVVLVVPARTTLALPWYLLTIGAIALITAIRVMTVRYPVLWRSSFDPAGKLPAMPAELPPQLRALDRLVARAGWDAAAFHLELQPILRAIAAQRLATYWTIDLDADPEAARAVLGERLWALLTPVDLVVARGDGGIDLDDLRAAVERLETLHVIPHA